MKVSELIEKLCKCNPNATVEFAYEADNTTSGEQISSVAQFVFLEDGEEGDISVVQLRV